MHSFSPNSTRPFAIPLIGLVGGVGSGKSTIARGVAERIPVAILDADRVGHEVLLRDEVKTEIRKAFGSAIFLNSGEIDRSRLAALVFGSEEKACRMRETLERIVHPIIRTDIKNQLNSVREIGQVMAVILDAPLLLESGWKELCDAVVFIDTPLVQRQKWTRSSRGWSEEELARREASQWPVARKRSESDYVINNSESLDSAVSQLERIIRELTVAATVTR